MGRSAGKVCRWLAVVALAVTLASCGDTTNTPRASLQLKVVSATKEISVGATTTNATTTSSATIVANSPTTAMAAMGTPAASDKPSVSLTGKTPLKMSKTVGDLTIDLTVTPKSGGDHLLDVQLTDAGHNAIGDAQVKIQSNSTEMDMGTQGLELKSVSQG